MSGLKLGVAQIDTRVGDLRGNTRRILDAASYACEHGADVVVFPEMAVPGYPPRDLLNNDSFVDAVEEATRWLARELRHTTVIVGTVQRAPYRPPHHPGLYNAAAVLREGRIDAVRAKRLLPSYDVFHEARWFIPGEAQPPILLNGVPVGLLLCEDMWDEGYAEHPPADLVRAGAQMLICLSASPFRVGISRQRRYHAQRASVPLLYVNAVGAQDELIFDGGSFFGHHQAPRFQEAVHVWQTASYAHHEVASLCGSETVRSETPADVYQALVLGVRGFAQKNGLRRAVLGLSGGVDSALVACIAADALGADNVTAVAIPSRYNDPRSLEEARALAKNLGIRFQVVPLETLHAAAEQTLGLQDDVTAQNVQARLRAMILMAYVNRQGGLLLNTSNKTELSLGYGTLYGDMAGTLGVLADVTKPMVYAMARRQHAIPTFILDRPPSAELRPDQTDPFDYDQVAPQLESEVEHHAPLAAEFKRWQMGVGLKVSPTAFGSGRLMPVTCHVNPDLMRTFKSSNEAVLKQ